MTKQPEFNPAIWELAREMAELDEAYDGSQNSPEFDYFYRLLSQDKSNNTLDNLHEITSY